MKRRRCCLLPVLFLSATVAATSAARMRRTPDGQRRRHDEGVSAAVAMGNHDRRRRLKKWNGIEVTEECKKFKNEELDECMAALLEVETAEPTESPGTSTPSAPRHRASPSALSLPPP